MKDGVHQVITSSESRKYKGIYFGCVLLCRDKCSKNKGETKFIWKPSEVTAIDGDTAIQLHYVGSPLKYDRWMSLQSDWKDLAPLKLLPKAQIENGEVLNTEQTTAVYEFLLSGSVQNQSPSVSPMNMDATPSTTRSGQSSRSGFNEIIQRMSSATSMAGSPSKGPTELFVGKKVEVRDIFQTKDNEELREKWRLAQVIEIRNEIVRIHYSGWDVKWDEDINLVAERDRIRERKRKSQSVDLSTPVAAPREVERHTARSCPRCGEHIPPLTEVPPMSALSTYSNSSTISQRGSFSRRSGGFPSGRGIASMSESYEDFSDQPTLFPHSASREELKDENMVDELAPKLTSASLSVEDRIHIALKVADRRLSSIQSTRNLLESTGPNPEFALVRRNSLGNLAKSPSSRSLIGITRRTSYPPPDQYRISFDGSSS